MKANDKISVQGWIYAPSYQSGEIGISVDYLKGSYETYDPNKLKLKSDIEPYLTWSKANNVPLFVGEFGAISSAPGNSRYNLVRDKISIMNAAGLHWSLWSYRDFVMPNVKEPYFGLYVNQIRDDKLAKVLKKGLQ
ncbi:MAG TPA: cellulase family glycosylhydrolase [Thiolinea sp.]|nr:cellulase family glycosylhydrolase [uncultured Thiothrix sp.]HMT94957.1 cellulase family glycosylhydrolase [Thiolinea sp.]